MDTLRQTERDAVTVEYFRNALIGTASDIQCCDPLNDFRLLGDDGQLTTTNSSIMRALS